MRAIDCFLAVWELPQNILGAITFGWNGARGRVTTARWERDRLLVEVEGGLAVSLGAFVFYATRDNPYVPVGKENVDHEYGHSIQSRWLGPLYLPIVGLPSTMRVAYAVVYRKSHGRRWAHYYDGWPERHADVLGRVDRSKRPAP